MDDHTRLFSQLAVSPHIVVAGKEMHLNTTFGYMAYRAEERVELTLALVLPEILVPEVKHIAQKVDGTRVAAHFIEQLNRFILMHQPVFYFTEPLRTTFEAKLFRGDELVLTKNVNMYDNVTCEADFSAGLEGLGTFIPGDYTVELLFEGKTVAKTSVMKVR